MNDNTLLLIKQISEEGNHEAFEKLYRIYFRKCFSFALFFTKSDEWAEDVVSDVFINLWQSRALLANIQDWDAYVYITVKNQSLHYLEQVQKRNQVSMDLFVVDIAVEEDNPEQLLLKQELTDVLQEAVNQLPEKCRLIYQMVREEGLSYKQIAAILDLSVRTVNTQMTIAVKKLGTTLKEYFK